MTRSIALIILALSAAVAVPSARAATGAAPLAGAIVPPTFGVLTVDPAARRTTLSGTAEPNAKVEVLDGARPIAAVTADGGGAFLATVNRALETGRHEFTLRATSSSGGTQLLSDARLVVVVPATDNGPVAVSLGGADVPGSLPVPAPGPVAAAPASPGPRTVVVKDGDSLWTIAVEALGDGEQWSALYDANRGQIPNPRRIYPGQVLVLPAPGKGPASAAN